MVEFWEEGRTYYQVTGDRRPLMRKAVCRSVRGGRARLHEFGDPDDVTFAATKCDWHVSQRAAVQEHCRTMWRRCEHTKCVHDAAYRESGFTSTDKTNLTLEKYERASDHLTTAIEFAIEGTFID